MDTNNNTSTNFQVVNSTEEIISKFDDFVKKNNLSLSQEKIFDFIAKISYFFANSNNNRLTPYFEDSLGKEMYNGEQVSHRNLYSVPKNVSNYYEFGKGNLVPFCKFSGKDEKHSSRNDFYIYVDIDNNLVYATLCVVREIVGKSGKVFAESDFSVTNLCIPDVKTISRGKSSDLLKNSSDVMTFNEQYSNFWSYFETIKKCIISISRIDTDCRHPNKFEDLPSLNKEKLKIAREYLKEKADAPHFHFCNKEYILKHKESDSSAIAISLNQIPDYLIALKVAQRFDEILKEDFGMPFLEISKKQTYYDYDMVLNLTQGIRDAYKSFNKEEKERLTSSIEMQCGLQSKKIARESNQNIAKQYLDDCIMIYNIITQSQDAIKSKDYVNVDAITLLNVEIEFLKIISQNSNIRSKISNKANLAYNDFFLTINESLGRKKFLHKKKSTNYNNYGYNYTTGLEK